MNRAIIYTVGDTHQIFLNLSDEEADRRWNKYRDDRNQFEIALEEKKGLEPHRSVVEFEDELLIWGNVVGEVNDMVAMMFQSMTKKPL